MKVEKYKKDADEYALGSLANKVYTLKIRVQNVAYLPNYKKGTLLEVQGYILHYNKNFVTKGNLIQNTVSWDDIINNLLGPSISLKLVMLIENYQIVEHQTLFK